MRGQRKGRAQQGYNRRHQIARAGQQRRQFADNLGQAHMQTNFFLGFAQSSRHRVFAFLQPTTGEGHLPGMGLQISGAQGQQHGRFRMQHKGHQHRRRRHAPTGACGAFHILPRGGPISAKPEGIGNARLQRGNGQRKRELPAHASGMSRTGASSMGKNIPSLQTPSTLRPSMISAWAKATNS